jgi:hypothetical protein
MTVSLPSERRPFGLPLAQLPKTGHCLKPDKAG